MPILMGLLEEDVLHMTTTIHIMGTATVTGMAILTVITGTVIIMDIHMDHSAVA